MLRRERTQLGRGRAIALAALSAGSMAACSSVAPAARVVAPIYESAAVATFQLPAPDLEHARKISLWATHYSIPRVRAVAENGHALLDPEGRSLGPLLSTRDFCDAAMEGTVQVRHDRRWRTYNFAGTGPDMQVDCSTWYPKNRAIGRSRFRVSTKPFGEGAFAERLVPFRSVAIDPKYVGRGAVIYVPAARGVEVVMPNGERRIHDGYFFAADTGGAIKGAHVDVFLGIRSTNPFSFITSHARPPFDAYLIDAPQLKELLARAHGAGAGGGGGVGDE